MKKKDFSLKWFGISDEVIVKHWKWLESLPKNNLGDLFPKDHKKP